MTERTVAVVGVGYWGKNLARNFADLEALHTVCDADDATRERIAGLHPGVRQTARYRDVLADESIRAVALATPAARHFEHAMQAFDAGKDVFVEKPLALRVSQGEELVRRAADTGRILMVGHVLHYHPAVEALGALVASGGIGQLRYVYSNRLNLGKVRTEENILWSFAPHDISIILGLVGSLPENVAASGGTYITDGVADVTVSQLSFRGGVRAHIFVSWLHPFKEQRLVVVGDEKMVVFDDTVREGKLKVYDKGIEARDGALVARQTAETTLFFDETEPLKRECQEFLDACRERRHARTDGENGLEVLRVLSACQDSLERGGLPSVLGGTS